MTAINAPQPMIPAGSGPLAPVGYAPPAVGAPASEPTGMTARDLWRVVKQRKLLITVVFVAAYLVVVGATVVTYKFWPLWASEAFIVLQPEMKGPLEPTRAIVPKEYVLQELSTEAALIKHPKLLLSVLELPEVKNTEYYQSFGDKFEKCLDDFERKLSAVPVRDTYLVRVSIALPSRSEAKDLVNTVARRHVEDRKARSTDEGQARLDQLKRTLAGGRGELEKVRKDIGSLREMQDMPALESQHNVLEGNLAVLNNTMSELKAREADTQAQLMVVNGMDPRNLPISAEMRLIIESDPQLRFYRQQVEGLDVQIEALLKTSYGPEHRVMKQLREQRDSVFAREMARREELIDDLRARQIEMLQQDQARINRMMLQIGEEITEREAKQRDLDSAIQKMRSLLSDEERLSDELVTVGEAVRAAENALAVARSEGRLTWIPAPREAFLPSRPNFIIYLGGGLILAALLALGLAFLREYTDQAIRTPLDVARFGHVSVLGTIPRLDDEEADVDAIEQATRLAPHSLVAEAFRQIRTNLTFSGPLASQQVLLVTSPRPEDGKSATAINLAVTFAQGNQRILLIDCNFRRPVLRAAFRNTRPEGLSNVLVGQLPLAQAVAHTELANLDVLTSGPMPPNPAELLSSPQMHSLLAAARQSYDRILLDGPPCLLISDALVLATQADAVLLVARAANSSKGALRRAREQFARINARVIGAILNGVQARPGGYFRQQYREFYEYTNEEIIPHELPSGAPELEGPPENQDNHSA